MTASIKAAVGNGCKGVEQAGPSGDRVQGFSERKRQQLEGTCCLLVQLHLSDSCFLQVPTATECGHVWQLLLSCCSAVHLLRGELFNLFMAQQERHLTTKPGYNRLPVRIWCLSHSAENRRRDGNTELGQKDFCCFLQSKLLNAAWAGADTSHLRYKAWYATAWHDFSVKYPNWKKKKKDSVITNISFLKRQLFMIPSPYPKSCCLLLKNLLNSLRKWHWSSLISRHCAKLNVNPLSLQLFSSLFSVYRTFQTV